MTPEQIKGIGKFRRLKVQHVAYVLAIYHLGVNVILFIEYSAQLDKRTNCCIEMNNLNPIADAVSSYLLLVALFLISLSLLTGVIINRGTLVMPFLALQSMDFLLSFLMFFTNYDNITFSHETFMQNNMAISKMDTESTFWSSFQMCHRLMITCSCYVEVPTFLHLTHTTYNTYPSASMSSEKYIKKMIIFSLLHTAVILYKALMIWCVWRIVKGSNDSAKNHSKDKHILKGVSKAALPSYMEAVMETKDFPPPYSTV
ncbi:lysosomal-associated transmembrane protein 5 [Phyllobates terribilis]|uniref:lysosomal-associated transmembrane protein 5 n=1 Tax=Phyllobates terribilis TaxID=111132 RepID=UPI003CCA7076